MYYAYELSTGTNVPKNQNDAVSYYESACLGGVAAACTHGGLVARAINNSFKAQRLFKLGCDRGDAEGCREQAAQQP
jgi:TPR repeat protein